MLKVLVVEDEKIIRQGIIMGTDWDALNCVVVAEASNGEEALEAVEQYNPSLIITDLKMPKLDGLEMLKILRSNGNRAFVIILTAYDSFEYAQNALRLGAVDFILKPFHDGELENAIEKVRERINAVENKVASFNLPKLERSDKSKYLFKAVEYINQNYNNHDITVGSVAEYVGISEGHLSHIFKKEAGYTPLNYITRFRIQKAMELLQDIGVRVYEVADSVGYKDVNYFSTKFKQIVGVSPSEYQNTCKAN